MNATRTLVRGTMGKAERCDNTARPLTHSLDLGEEGIAVKATPKLCDAPTCQAAPRSPGSKWCEQHYYRMRKYGTLDLPPGRFHSTRECAADGCTSAGKSKGYCGKHWERIRKHGNPDTVAVIRDDPERRFWTYVDKTDSCWLWTGALTYDGYGIFGVGSQRTGPHRWVLMFAGVEIPEGMQVDHLCRVRNCVNPDHLEVVTVEENWRRALEVRMEARK